MGRMTQGSGGSRLALAALGGSAMLLMAAPAVPAAPMWLTPAKLSMSGHSAERPQVATDAQGDAIAVWERFNGSAKVLESSVRVAGSSWQPPLTLSSGEQEASSPRVALDSHGDAVVAWEGYDAKSKEYAVEVAVKSGLGGSWQPPTTLSLLGVKMEPPPKLAVDPQGGAVAIWQREEKTVEASSRPAGGSWQPPETLSSTAEAQHSAQVAVDAAGNATAVWEERGPGEVLIDAASKPLGGKWQVGTALSASGGNANEPRVAVDAQGDATAVWERFNVGESEEVIEEAGRPAASGAWGMPVALTRHVLGVGEPGNQEVAIDAHGNAVVVWGRYHGVHETIEAAEGPISSPSWSPAVVLSGPGVSAEEAPQVGVDGQGNAIVVWERSNGTNNIVEAASGTSSSGSWQPPVTLSAAGEDALEPQVALDAQGNAAAIWRRNDGTSYIAEAEGLDAAGPQLNSLSIPSAGTVGQALTFSVSPLDVWSTLATTGWTLGDGTSQTGTSITHAYGLPGPYTVTVTSTDALGNVTSTSAALSISGPAVPAPVAPTITGARLSHQRFRVSRRATAISARLSVPQGTSFRFTLSEAARLQITFTSSAPGLRSGRRCLAPTTTLRRHHARRCTRTITLGTLTRGHEPAGTDTVAFSGRIGSRALAPGAYKATLTANAGGVRSVPVSLSLIVVR